MLTKSELKWHTQEKEALAIVWGCNKFRPYLLGAPFIIRTDHQSLKWLWRSEKGRLARWALSMSEFDYKIVHRPGIKNTNADVASRWTKEAADESWNPLPDHAFVGNIITSIDDNIIGTISPQSDDSSINLVDEIMKSQQSCNYIKQSMDKILSNDMIAVNNELPIGYTKSKRSMQFMIHRNMLCRVIVDSHDKLSLDSRRRC